MFLSRNFNYSSRLLSLATKIVVNQCVFTPLFNSYFFGMQAFLAGDTLVEVWERIKRTVPTSMVNSIKVWPLVTAVNFTWVPIEVRRLSGCPCRGNKGWFLLWIFPVTHRNGSATCVDE